MNDSFYEFLSLFEHNLIRLMHHGEVSHDSFGVVSEPNKLKYLAKIFPGSN